MCLSYSVPLSVHTSLFANFHYNKALVWFEAYGFCYWTLLGYPVVTLYHGDLAALGQQDRPFHKLQPFLHEVEFEVGQLKALDPKSTHSFLTQ